MKSDISTKMATNLAYPMQFKKHGFTRPEFSDMVSSKKDILLQATDHFDVLSNMPWHTAIDNVTKAVCLQETEGNPNRLDRRTSTALDAYRSMGHLPVEGSELEGASPKHLQSVTGGKYEAQQHEGYHLEQEKLFLRLQAMEKLEGNVIPGEPCSTAALCTTIDAVTIRFMNDIVTTPQGTITV